MGHVVIDLAGPQQRLGRDAPPVEADTAQALALDDGDLQAQLRGADGSDITAGAGAEDDEIERFSHAYLPPAGCQPSRQTT